MKVISRLITALIFSSASIGAAYPNFGDRATLVGVSTSAKGVETKIRLSWSITEFERYTPDLSSLPVLGIYSQNEKSKQSEKYLLRSKMWTQAKVKIQLAKCEARGGKSELVQTLIGVLKTCRMNVSGKSRSVTYWIADVPFGIARIETINKSGKKTSLILASAAAGARPARK